jgi:hypothetical protein
MATIGAKRKRQTYHPPSELGPYHHHPVHQEYVGWQDGRIWSTKSGKFIEGRSKNGYTLLGIGAANISRHRFNFEIANQRCTEEKREIDHIDQNKMNDSWANLQELTKNEHAKKTANDNPDSGRKGSISQGSSIVAKNLDTGVESNFHSHMEAARELGLDAQNIGKQLMGKLTRVGRYTFAVDPVYGATQADQIGETWKSIPTGAALSYGMSVDLFADIMVSSLGRVQYKKGRRSYGSSAVANEATSYMVAKIGAGVQRKCLRVHVLVALAFIGARPSEVHTVDHVDGTKNNNAFGNLRWATTIEQASNQRSNRPVDKLSLTTGQVLETFLTISEAARLTDTPKAGINMVCLGTRKKSGLWLEVHSTFVYLREISTNRLQQK